MIESEYKKKGLLLGNGINLLDMSQSYSWGELLHRLKFIYNINVDLDNVFKPFPLAFDEMQHNKIGHNNLTSKLKNLKQTIRREIENQLEGKKGYNEYHVKMASLDYDAILTTNYDYSLQLSIQPDFLQLKKKLAINRQERKFSLKRCYKLPSRNTTFWHIHGELFDSRNHTATSNSYPEESILIGYEHYASYLEKIQENIKGKSGAQKVANQSLLVRIRNEQPSPFWTDIFFTHNLDIVGLGFDFSENHLWWLINYRANLIKKQNLRHNVEINNTIRFFHPSIYPGQGESPRLYDKTGLDQFIKKKNGVLKSKAIAEVLNAFEVKSVPIECESYDDFYRRLISVYLNDF